MATYEEAVHLKAETSDVHYQGVKSSSVFNSLLHYHIANPGLPLCLGHDLFEGIVKSDLAICTEYFVKGNKWFTYDQLNCK